MCAPWHIGSYTQEMNETGRKPGYVLDIEMLSCFICMYNSIGWITESFLSRDLNPLRAESF